MKKGIILLVCILLFMSLSTFTSADEQKVKITVDVANLRINPSLQSDVIAKLPMNSEVTVISKMGDWYQVQLPPDASGVVITGYIHTSVVEEATTQAAPAFTPPPPPPSATKTKTQTAPPPPPAPRQTATIPTYAPPAAAAAVTWPKFGIFARGGYGGSGIAASGGISYNVMKFLGIELSGGYFSVDEEGDTTDPNALMQGKLTTIPLQFSLIFRFEMNKIAPYIAAGLGYYLNSYEIDGAIVTEWDDAGFTIEDAVDPSLGYHAGAGLDYLLTGNLAVNLDFKYILLNPDGTWTITDQVGSTSATGELADLNFSTFTITLGIKYFF
jgi:opacity protein-like surface antigen